MKTKILMGGLLVVVLTFLFACNQEKKEVKIDKEMIKAEIQVLENNLAFVFNNGDVDALKYYADDAVSYFAGQDPIVGIEAIHSHIENELINFPEGATLSFETVEIYVSDNGEHVAEIGSHKLVDSIGIIMQRGHYMSFFAKRDGKFLCTRDMANSVTVDN